MGFLDRQVSAFYTTFFSGLRRGPLARLEAPAANPQARVRKRPVERELEASNKSETKEMIFIIQLNARTKKQFVCYDGEMHHDGFRNNQKQQRCNDRKVRLES
jgi:hypothetical protein